VPYLLRYSRTNLCDGAQMAIFWPYFASCTTCSTWSAATSCLDLSFCVFLVEHLIRLTCTPCGTVRSIAKPDVIQGSEPDFSSMFILCYGIFRFYWCMCAFVVLDLVSSVLCLPSSSQHLSSDDCLEDKRKDCRNYSVLHCIRQLCTMTHTHISSFKVYCWFSLSFRFGFAFCAFFTILFLCCLILLC